MFRLGSDLGTDEEAAMIGDFGIGEALSLGLQTLSTGWGAYSQFQNLQSQSDALEAQQAQAQAAYALQMRQLAAQQAAQQQATQLAAQQAAQQQAAQQQAAQLAAQQAAARGDGSSDSTYLYIGGGVALAVLIAVLVSRR